MGVAAPAAFLVLLDLLRVGHLRQSTAFMIGGMVLALWSLWILSTLGIRHRFQKTTLLLVPSALIVSADLSAHGAVQWSTIHAITGAGGVLAAQWYLERLKRASTIQP